MSDHNIFYSNISTYPVQNFCVKETFSTYNIWKIYEKASLIISPNKAVKTLLTRSF